MFDIDGLRRARKERFFAAWDGRVAAKAVEAAEEAIRSLIDGLIALGPCGTETDVREKVDQCVEQFNQLDNGWITTIERDDIGDCLSRIVGLCGMDRSADWVAENRVW